MGVDPERHGVFPGAQFRAFGCLSYDCMVFQGSSPLWLAATPGRRCWPLAIGLWATPLHEAEAVHATAYLDGHSAPMKRIDDSHVWEAEVSILHDGVYPLKVSVEDIHGKIATDEIHVVSRDLAKRERLERDQDNALEAWPEHGLLGTQLGPNKNGKKW